MLDNSGVAAQFTETPQATAALHSTHILGGAATTEDDQRRLARRHRRPGPINGRKITARAWFQLLCCARSAEQPTAGAGR